MRRRTTLAASAAAATAALAALVGCGGGGSQAGPAATVAGPVTATHAAAATTAPSGGASATNPCSLLTDAEVARLAPGIGHGKLDTVAGARICDWPDAHGIPAVQLQVYAAPSSSLRAQLSNGIGAFGGYRIVDVSGLGDEAAAAFQKADPSKGLEPGLAALSVRSGDRVVGLTTPLVQVREGSPAFALVERLAAKALARLEGSR